MAGDGPKIAQAMKARIATPTTAGTNQAATRSTRLWIGARERWASATICTIRASMVSLPTRSARMTKLPDWLRVPPLTLSPGAFSTGTGSPVSIDSSTVLRPSCTTPSTGIWSPGRTRSRSPTCTSSSATSSSAPSARTRRVVFGARPSNALIAPLVRSRAPISRIWPSRTRAVITAAASK